MDILIKPAVLSGTAEGVSSKSYVQRALICAALSEGQSEIECNNFCDDIMTMADCLRRLGAVITKNDTGFSVTGIDRFPEQADIDCKDSGTALRFLLPLLAVNGCKGKITVFPSLARRPVSELVDSLNRNGAEISGLEILKAPTAGNVFEIPGNISSQYISGLLLALPVSPDGGIIRLTNRLQSEGYVDMTVKTAEEFGVHIEKKPDGYFVRGGQKYTACRYYAEADWSSAAYWLALGCSVSGLSSTSLQPDSVFPDIKESSIINAENMPDLVPVLAANAVMRHGTTVIEGTERLRYKETDRISTITDSLSVIGADIRHEENRLIINGKGLLPGGTVDSYGDHRIVMMIAAISAKCMNDVIIRNAECVSKSCPSFFDTFNKLGGNAHVIQLR